MNREKNIEIANDTLKVIKNGYYVHKGKKIKIKLPFMYSEGYDDVTVLSPEKLESIANDDDETFQRAFCASKYCSFYLIDADSFDAAGSFTHGLVMNFANAHTAGGGFLSGANAQEESLCRCSTLYASISSKEATVMYDYNNSINEPADSDFMLLTKDVCVFRNHNEEYLDTPFRTSVMTVAAPNVNGKASIIPDDELYGILKTRLRYFLYASAYHGYRDLVLGAWGCGAFGNDPYTVANCFYELFFEDGFEQFFDNIVFAILGGGENYKAFADVFGDKIDDCGSDDVREDDKNDRFTQSFYHRPICNHSVNDIGPENLGYTFGVFADGVPFEADLWEIDGKRSISVYMPDIYAKSQAGKSDENSKKEIFFESHVEQRSESVLGIGMAIREPEYYEEIAYINYLERMGIITFEERVKNGGVEFLTDIEGNDIACIHIEIEGVKNGKVTCNLNFREFPSYNRKPKIKIFGVND